MKAYLSDKTSDAATIARAVRSNLFGFCDGRKLEKWLNEKRRSIGRWRKPLPKGETALFGVACRSHGDRQGEGWKHPTYSRVELTEPLWSVTSDTSRTRWKQIFARTVSRDSIRLTATISLRSLLWIKEHAFQQWLAPMVSPPSHTSGTNGCLPDHGIDPAQVSDRMTIYDLAEMSAFSRKLDAGDSRAWTHRTSHRP